MKIKYFINSLVVISCSFSMHVDATQPDLSYKIADLERNTHSLTKKELVSTAAGIYINVRSFINPYLVNKIIDKQRYPYHHYAATTGVNVLSYILAYKLVDKNISTAKVAHNATLNTATIVAGDVLNTAAERIAEKCSPGINQIGICTMLSRFQIKNLVILGTTQAASKVGQHYIDDWIAQYHKSL